MVAQYYWVIRAVVKQKPHLRESLTRCRHCRILFLTHPRNAGRRDLRCPFGCREAHRRYQSTKRSTEYYRTKEGKDKKSDLNARRCAKDHRCKHAKEAEKEKNHCKDLQAPLDEPTLSYLQTVTSLIEARTVCRKEIIKLVNTILRQHRIDQSLKLLYTVKNCRAKPP